MVKAILSGLMIGVGGTVYLSCDNKYIGGFLFSFGLFTIIQYGFNLYTGKVGYIPEREPAYIIDVILIFLGNMIGTAAAAFAPLGAVRVIWWCPWTRPPANA